MTGITRKCPYCGGCGRVQVTGEYADTLAMLGRRKKPVNGAELAREAGINATAMNNRLVKLEEFGLATGVRSGRERLWTAAKGGTP